MTQRRRFSARERTALYLAADGRCERCGRELEPGWHADHVTPYVAGGPTDLINGQALCPDCNASKGSQMGDRIQLRPFQQEMTDVILDRVANRERVTVAWVNAGSGKSLGWMNAITQMKRQGLDVPVMTLVPRRNLRVQAELDWCAPEAWDSAGRYRGGFMYLYEDPKLGLVVARENRTPLTEARHAGYIACYASVSSNPRIHVEWARKRRGLFVLVLDEAQYLGLPKRPDSRDEDDPGGGTLAAQAVHEIMQYARHTIIMSGTPERSDGHPIVGATYSAPDASGRRKLEWHVRATYKQGVTGRYLRPVQFSLHGGEGEFTDGAEFKIEQLEERLRPILVDERIWRPRVDEVCDRLRDVHRLDIGYRALITAPSIPVAKKMYSYIKARHRDLVPLLAVSDDDSAQSELQRFRCGEAQVLITVQMAYIGYDHKPITVIGLMNAIRWHGNLEQTIARGTRIWSDRPTEEQTCYVIGLNDPALRMFAKQMREESEAGLRERATCGNGGGTSTADPDVDVSRYQDGNEQIIGLNDAQDIADPVQLANIRALRQQHDLFDSEAKLNAFAASIANGAPAPTPASVTVPVQTIPETEEQQRKRLTSKYQGLLGQYIKQRHGINPGEHRDEFAKLMAKYQAADNRDQSVRSARNASPDQIQDRINSYARRLEG